MTETTKRPFTWIKCLSENERLRTQVAAMPAEIARQTKSLRDDLEHYLEEIKALHLEYQQTDCTGCDGKGIVVETVCGTGGPGDSSPPEYSEEFTCPDCLGTSKEWGV